MRELNISDCQQVSGGFHIHIGHMIAGIVLGAVTGGPVGIGYALCTIVMAKGIDNLEDLARQK